MPPPTFARHFVVFGGSGFVGTSVVERLVRRLGGGGGRIVVPTRRLARAVHLRLLPTVEIVEADIDDDAQLLALTSGANVAINLIARLHGDHAAFERTHTALPRRILHACQRHGVARLIHVSALGADGPDLPSRYLRSKAAGERALHASRHGAGADAREDARADAHGGAGVGVTILRPSVMFGARDRSTQLFAAMQRRLPFVPLAGATATLQPVWVEDVAQAIVRCVDTHPTASDAFECAGPDVMTLADFFRRAGRHAGVERAIVAMPRAVGRLQASVLELGGLFGEPLMSRDNLDSLRLPSVATPGVPGLAALGIHPASFDQIAPTYLHPSSGPARLDAWRATARRD